MPSITTWNRLEPKSRDESPEAGLRAEMRDPLWLLGRQWQLGEFLAEDAGSPVRVRLRTTSHQLSRYRAGRIDPGDDEPGRPYDPGDVPLEAVAGGRRLQERRGAALRRAAEAGAELLARLDSAGLGAYRGAYLAAYALEDLAPGDELAPRARRWRALLAGRTIDGTRLFSDVHAALHESDEPGLPERPDVQLADVAKMLETVTDFYEWARDELFGDPGADDAWQRERLEYAFGVAARGSTDEDVVLVADPWGDQPLGWTSFDVQPGASLGAVAHHETREEVLVPSPVRYHSMPQTRFWEIEDDRVDFAKIRVDASDIGRMVFIEFALVYGNDWFMVPVTLPFGQLSQVEELVVTDSFGGELSIPPVPSQPSGPDTWSLFRMATRGAAAGDPPGAPAPYLFLAPASISSDAGPTIEEIGFLRDEMANLVWGVERRFEDASGRAQDREHAVVPPSDPAGGDQRVGYQLQHEVPASWVPLVPSMEDDTLYLRRGTLSAERGAAEPAGSLLAELVGERLHHHEVPREGVEVQERWRFARAADGSSHAWLSRRWRVGRGPGSSGLVYDRLVRD